MHRLSGALLMVWWSCAPPVEAPPDAGVEPPRLRVRAATFDTLRFFDTVCDTGACAAGDYEAQPTQERFDARAAQLANAIDGFGADLVSLQEVETQACLDALQVRLQRAMPHAVLGELGTPASVDVAIFSRTSLESVITHRAQTPLTRPDGTTTSFSRELLEVHTLVEGRRVILFAAHFRSKVNDDAGRRLAEAQATRRLVLAAAEAHPGALVLLGGDLNDTPGSAPLEALEEGGRLVRAAADLPVDEQVTWASGTLREAIDHLYQAVDDAVAPVPRSARSWKEGARGFAGSDHFALTAEWEFEP